MNDRDLNKTIPKKKAKGQLFTFLLNLFLFFILTEVNPQYHTIIQSAGLQNAWSDDTGLINIETSRNTLRFIYSAIELNTSGMYENSTIEEINWAINNNL